MATPCQYISFETWRQELRAVSNQLRELRAGQRALVSWQRLLKLVNGTLYDPHQHPLPANRKVDDDDYCELLARMDILILALQQETRTARMASAQLQEAQTRKYRGRVWRELRRALETFADAPGVGSFWGTPSASVPSWSCRRDAAVATLVPASPTSSTDVRTPYNASREASHRIKGFSQWRARVAQRIQRCLLAEAQDYLSAGNIFVRIEEERLLLNLPSPDDALVEGILCITMGCGVLLSDTFREEENPLPRVVYEDAGNALHRHVKGFREEESIRRQERHQRDEGTREASGVARNANVAVLTTGVSDAPQPPVDAGATAAVDSRAVAFAAMKHFPSAAGCPHTTTIYTALVRLAAALHHTLHCHEQSANLYELAAIVLLETIPNWVRARGPLADHIEGPSSPSSEDEAEHSGRAGHLPGGRANVAEDPGGASTHADAKQRPLDVDLTPHDPIPPLSRDEDSHPPPSSDLPSVGSTRPPSPLPRGRGAHQQLSSPLQPHPTHEAAHTLSAPTAGTTVRGVAGTSRPGKAERVYPLTGPGSYYERVLRDYCLREHQRHHQQEQPRASNTRGSAADPRPRTTTSPSTTSALASGGVAAATDGANPVTEFLAAAYAVKVQHGYLLNFARAMQAACEVCITTADYVRALVYADAALRGVDTEERIQFSGTSVRACLHRQRDGGRKASDDPVSCGHHQRKTRPDESVESGAAPADRADFEDYLHFRTTYAATMITMHVSRVLILLLLRAEWLVNDGERYAGPSSSPQRHRFSAVETGSDGHGKPDGDARDDDGAAITATVQESIATLRALAEDLAEEMQRTSVMHCGPDGAGPPSWGPPMDTAQVPSPTPHTATRVERAVDSVFVVGLCRSYRRRTPAPGRGAGQWNHHSTDGGDGSASTSLSRIVLASRGYQQLKARYTSQDVAAGEACPTAAAAREPQWLSPDLGPKEDANTVLNAGHTTHEARQRPTDSSGGAAKACPSPDRPPPPARHDTETSPVLPEPLPTPGARGPTYVMALLALIESLDVLQQWSCLGGGPVMGPREPSQGGGPAGESLLEEGGAVRRWYSPVVDAQMLGLERQLHGVGVRSRPLVRLITRLGRAWYHPRIQASPLLQAE